MAHYTESVVEQAAMANYTESGGQGRAAIDQDEAVTLVLEKFEICCGLFHGFDWSRWKSGLPQARATELVLEQAEVLSRDWAENV